MKFHQLLALVDAASFGVDDESYNDILHAFLTSDYEEEEVVISFRSDISGKKGRRERAMSTQRTIAFLHYFRKNTFIIQMKRIK